jgi:hypothetical protein
MNKHEAYALLLDLKQRLENGAMDFEDGTIEALDMIMNDFDLEEDALYDPPQNWCGEQAIGCTFDE